MRYFSSQIKKIIVTGGAGFIGGHLIRALLEDTSLEIFNIDKYGYASDLSGINNYINKKSINSDRYKYIKIDLINFEEIDHRIKTIEPDIIFHLAAESHVDRSILEPKFFVESNILGTFNILRAVKTYWESLPSEKKNIFKIIHVSTDEVFGSLGRVKLFNEFSNYNPRSPYSATKAASDHLVSSYFFTYGLPSIITYSSNNFGPWQFTEKLIPTIIKNALSNNKIPIYGDGKNVRDWIYVKDHISALIKVAQKGITGESYCIGANQQKSNNEITEIICKIIDNIKPLNAPHIRFKTYINDRKGHDKCYGLDNSKIVSDLNWKPKYDFISSMKKTINWYIDNQKLAK